MSGMRNQSQSNRQENSVSKQVGELLEELKVPDRIIAGTSFHKERRDAQKEKSRLNKEATFKLADDTLNRLHKSLKAGKSEQLQTFLKTVSKFHSYSLRNQLLIACQKSNATRVAGYGAWQKMNRQVRKGEKGIRILAPIVRKKNDQEGEENTKEKRVVGYRSASVFDISQTDGEQLPNLSSIKGDPGTNLRQLRRLVQSKGIELKTESLDGAEGLSKGGVIVIEESLDAPKQFAVLAHEFAHELLHKTDRRASTTKTMRETEAESVAFVVCEAFGIESELHSSDYIQLYGGTPEILTESLNYIRKAAIEIIDGIETLDRKC